MAASSQHAAFFDVDGVLLDSLVHHLSYCQLKAQEYHLNILVPSPTAFRKSVSRGVPVGPMSNFFRAVGFPENCIQRAVQDYEREFADRFASTPFPGAGPMLVQLRDAGFAIGLVTSNVRKNVEQGLQDLIALFDPRCLFYFDREPGRRGKPADLIEGAQVLRLPLDLCTYVGDQPSDATAARTAGTRFLGVTYGWSADFGDDPVPTVNSVAAISHHLLAQRP